MSSHPPHCPKHTGADGPSTCGQDAPGKSGWLLLQGRLPDAQIVPLGQLAVSSLGTGNVLGGQPVTDGGPWVAAQGCVSFTSCSRKMIKSSEGLIYVEKGKELNLCRLAQP